MDKRKRIINRNIVAEVSTVEQNEVTPVVEEIKVEESALATVFANCEKVEDETVEQSQDAVAEVTEDMVETVEAEERTELTEIVDDVDETIDKTLQDIAEAEANLDEQSDKESENKKLTLSKLDENAHMVELAAFQVDGSVYTIIMKKIANKARKLIRGFSFTVLKNGIPQHDTTAVEVKKSVEYIKNAENPDAFNFLKNFDFEISVDQIKEAYERATKYAQVAKMAHDNSGDSIAEIYVDVVENALIRCELEQKESERIVDGKSVLPDIRRNFIKGYYDNSKGNKVEVIDISKEGLKQLLEDAGTDCLPSTFAKKLRDFGYDAGVEVLLREKSRNQCNRTFAEGQRRFYRLVIDQEFINKIKGAF